MEVTFAGAMERKQVMRLRDLNSGFSNPELISLAYYEASLLVEHVVARFGEPSLRELVRVFADDLDTEQAIQQALKVSIDDLQKTFDGFLDERFGALRRALDDARGLRGRRAARAAAHAGQRQCRQLPGADGARRARSRRPIPTAALAAYERAAALVPIATGEGSPQSRIAALKLAKGDKAGAARALETLTTNDHTDVASARQLVGLLDQPADAARRKAALAKVVAVDPFDAAAHTELGRFALADGQVPAALQAFRVAIAAGAQDRAGAHADLGEALEKSGDLRRRQEAGAGRARSRAVVRAGAGPAAAPGGAAPVNGAPRRDGPRPERPRRASVPVVAAAVALIALVVPAVSSLAREAVAQAGVFREERLAGLQWTFVRVKYTPTTGDLAMRTRFGFWDDPWAIDAPAAEQNLSRRLQTATAIEVGEPLVMALDDPRLWQYPWLYLVEPSNLVLSDDEAATLREFLLRGGTLTLDDFHGSFEWDLTVRQLAKVFPDREIVDLPASHPIFSCFYTLDRYPQVPGLGSFFNGRTWEKGGFTARLRAILDDAGRPMVLINWNTDMGDGWEWSNAEEYPGYLKWTAVAYQMMINEVVYTLTH